MFEAVVELKIIPNFHRGVSALLNVYVRDDPQLDLGDASAGDGVVDVRERPENLNVGR